MTKYVFRKVNIAEVLMCIVHIRNDEHLNYGNDAENEEEGKELKIFYKMTSKRSFMRIYEKIHERIIFQT